MSSAQNIEKLKWFLMGKNNEVELLHMTKFNLEDFMKKYNLKNDTMTEKEVENFTTIPIIPDNL